jgi:hypothetical protein
VRGLRRERGCAKERQRWKKPEAGGESAGGHDENALDGISNNDAQKPRRTN